MKTRIECLKTIIANFNPAWFSVAMGTGMVPLAISFLEFSNKNFVAISFFVLTLIMTLLILIPWCAKFLFFFKNVNKELDHPITSSFFPTMPIALIILALNFLKYPFLFTNIKTSYDCALILWIIGTIGIYIMGFVILTHAFKRSSTKIQHANFSWYIPPVSKLAIALCGFEIAKFFPGQAEWIFIISIISLGIGFFLFLFVGANVYHRYLYHELPINKLAATFFIGMTPTSIISIIIFKMIDLFKSHDLLNTHYQALIPIGKIIMLISWGLSIWWFIMASIIISYYVKKIDLPYAISWWAFTFPLGSLCISSGVMWKITNYPFMQQIYWIMIGIFLLTWVIVFMRTLKEIFSGNLFWCHKTQND